MSETPGVPDLRAAFDALPSARRFKPQEIEVLYGMAHSALTAGSHADAQGIFDLLIIYAGSQSRMWAGRAAACESQGNWRDALAAWSMAALLDPERVEYTLLSGHAELMLGKLPQARLTLTLALRAAQRLGDATSGARAEAMLGLLGRKGQ